MYKLLIILILPMFLYSYDVLVITNTTVDRTDHKAYKKALKDVKKSIEKQYPKINIIYTNMEKNVTKEIRQLLKKDYLFIVAPGLSKRFQDVASYLPKDTPIITASTSNKALNCYKNILFSTSSSSRYSKARDIAKIQKLKKFKTIINIYDITKGVYPQNILQFFKKDNPNIKIVDVDIKNFNKELLDKYDNVLLYISADNGKFTKILLDKANFILRNIEFLYDKKYGCYYYIPYHSSVYNFKNKKEIFSSSSALGGKKNIFEYDYLKKIKYKNEKLMSRYDQAYRWNYSKIMLGLNGLSNFNADINVLRRLVYNNLKKTSKEPFIDHKTRYIFSLEKETKNIYFNSAFKNNILNTYLYIPSSGQKLLYPTQIINNKKLQTIYITPHIKKLKVLTLDASKVKVDMVVKILSLNKKIELGKDILLKSADKDNLEIRLLKESSVDSFIHGLKLHYKVYDVSLTVNINNMLFKFPYDKQVINIPFYSNNFSNNEVIIQMLNDIQPYSFSMSDNWLIRKHFATYSRNIYKIENNLDDKSKIISSFTNYYTLEIERKKPFQIIVKYFLPAMILLVLAIFISYFVFKRYSQNHIGIISDVLLGIISIYFIYSLLIQIETLIVLDLIFYFIIFIVIVFILIALFLEKKGKVGNTKF